MKTKLKWILIAIGFFSLSRGLWYNYQSLWLQDNGLSIKTISTVTSLSALGCVCAMILFFDFITKKRLKGFMCLLLGLKTLTLITLFFMNGSNLFIPIKLLILLDIVLDTEIVVSVYPLLTLFTKDDKLYGKKDLVNSSCYDIGICIGAFFLGKTIFNIKINFNIFILLSIVCCIIAFFIILKTEVKTSKEKRRNSNEILCNMMSFIRKDKMSIYYLLFVFTINAAFSLVAGLKMLLLTNIVGFTANKASLYLLIISIIADIVGIIVLNKLTAKNNVINIMIKCGGRVVVFFIAFLFHNVYAILLALTYTLLFSNSYSHVLDAPYINRIDNDFQFAFSNFRDMISYVAQSLGIFLCGIFFDFGIKYIFLIAAIFGVLQVCFAIKANRLKIEE